MRYEDLEIEIRSTPSGGYEVAARDFQRLRRRADLELPFDAAHAEEAFQGSRGRPLPADDEGSLERSVGVPLYQALFQEPVRLILAQGQQALELAPATTETQGLRIRLLFGAPPDRPLQQDDLLRADYTRIGSLPWELLCDPDTGQPMALSAATPVVRTLDSVRPARPIEVELPLRVLVVCCAPQSLKQLDVEAEKARIRTALRDDHVVVVHFEDDPPPTKLARLLRSGRYHALHFIGHGGFDEEVGGYLCFRRPDALPEQDLDRVSGRELAQLLAGCPDLRIVVLNACRTAQMPRLPDQNPWHAVAAALSLAGVPAVVAMQYPISDPAAIAFSGTFYESLAAGFSLEEAITDARFEISRRTPEWGTPVLFLQGKDGRLLRLNGPPVADRGEPSSAPLRLGIRSFLGWNRAQIDDGDRVLSLSRYFDGRFLREGETWDGSIRPRVRRFLLEAVADRRPIDLLFAAHQSIAFAAGHFLEAMSGARLGVLQPTMNRSLGDSSQAWRWDTGPVPQGPLWARTDDLPKDPDAEDLAVVVEITTPALESVEEYLEKSGLRVRRVLVVTVAPEPGKSVLQGGAHALALAENLANLIARHTAAAPHGVLHLFASVPNAFLVFLGQLSTTFGRIQLYEHDKQKERHGLYEPSISLPVPASAGTPGKISGPRQAQRKKLGGRS